MTAPDRRLPLGFTVVLDPDTRQLAPDLLFGGSPHRLLRLSASGVRALDELHAGPIQTAAAAMLAGRLVDAGLAHPRPPDTTGRDLSVTVVIPVRDRAAELDRCLSALGDRHPVIVVDDGSSDPAAVAAVCAARRARLVRHDTNRGPAAARNTGPRQADTDLIAFLDSDCLPDRDWINRLAGQFADPRVAAVAPRIRPLTGDDRTAARYTAARCALDLGEREAQVRPMSKVSYVPTAALLVRRIALHDTGFHEDLRVGEDVDLIWRLIDAGWRVRYHPETTVGHREPPTWAGLLSRRYRYGTSAAPLSTRHPGTLAPLVLLPGPALAVAAYAARRPLVMGATVGAAALQLRHQLTARGIPTAGVARAAATGVWQTWLGSARWSAQFAPWLLPAVALGKPGPRLRRVAAAAALVLPPLVEWQQTRPRLDPIRFSVGVLADQAAYGLGVWRSCLRERTLAPVQPKLTHRWIPE